MKMFLINIVTNVLGTGDHLESNENQYSTWSHNAWFQRPTFPLGLPGPPPIDPPQFRSPPVPSPTVFSNQRSPPGGPPFVFFFFPPPPPPKEKCVQSVGIILGVYYSFRCWLWLVGLQKKDLPRSLYRSNLHQPPVTNWALYEPTLTYTTPRKISLTNCPKWPQPVHWAYLIQILAKPISVKPSRLTVPHRSDVVAYATSFLLLNWLSWVNWAGRLVGWSLACVQEVQPNWIYVRECFPKPHLWNTFTSAGY